MGSAKSTMMFRLKIQQISLAAVVACYCLAQSPGPAGEPVPSKSPLIGTWHNVTQPQFPQAMLMICADGYYSQITVSPGRKKPGHDFDHRTREELAKQFG